jgi:hypothetical protein
MTSVVSICNLALSNIGKANISTLTEASAEARACNQFYEQTRDAFLQSFPWSVAGKTAALAEVTNDKLGRWQRAYMLPTDCLKVRSIQPDPVAPQREQSQLERLAADYANGFEIEGETLYTNLAPCFLVYTYRMTDPTKLTPLMVDALAWNLAVPLAMPLTRDPKIRADSKNIAQAASAEAAAADVPRSATSYDHGPSLVEARH